MLPAPELTEIIANLSALNLSADTTAAVIGAVLAPLLRSSDASVSRDTGTRPIREKPRRRGGSRRGRKYKRHAPTEARDRALAAMQANPGATPTELAKLAKCSRSTIVNVRKEQVKQARKEARKAVRAAPDKRERAQRFLKDTLSSGPKQVSAIEDAAERAHVDPQALAQARADLGVVTSRGNAGGVQAVQWSLPG